MYYYPTCGCTPTIAAAALALYQQPAGAGYTNTCQRARRMLCDTPSAPAVTAAVLGLCRQPAGACAPPALQSRISAPAPAAVAAVRALAHSSGFQERVQTPHAQGHAKGYILPLSREGAVAGHQGRWEGKLQNFTIAGVISGMHCARSYKHTMQNVSRLKCVSCSHQHSLSSLKRMKHMHQRLSTTLPTHPPRGGATHGPTWHKHSTRGQESHVYRGW